MKLGMGWWGFRELPFQNHLDICQQFGFKTLEIGLGDELISTFRIELDERKIIETKSIASKMDISIPFATVENDFTLTNNEEHIKMLNHVKKSIESAVLFGVTHLRLFIGFMPAEHVTNRIYSQALDAIKRCELICSENDIIISLETHGKIVHKDGVAFHHNTISTDPNFLERLMKDLPQNVGFNYDPGNIKAVRPNDKSYCLDIINERINYCHLKDWKKHQGGWKAVAIGDDDLDYSKILKKMKFNGVYLIEYEPLYDSIDGIKRSLNHLSSIGINYVL